MSPTRSPHPLPLLLTLLAVAGTGCVGHHHKMIERTEWLRTAGRHHDALDYLERYLGQHADSEEAWRYRVHIRMDLDQRAAAAAEYWRMQTALQRRDPDLLAEIVLGRGGQWITDDFMALARCDDAAHFGGASLFEQQLLGRQAAPGSDIYLAPRQETVIAVMDALPGALGERAIPLVRGTLAESPTPDVRLAAARAAVRLLGDADELARPLIDTALRDSVPRVRRGTLEALLGPEGPAIPAGWAPMPGEHDAAVAMGWLGVAARLDEPTAGAIRAPLQAAVPLVAAMYAVPLGAEAEGDEPAAADPGAVPSGDDPLSTLIADLWRGRCEPASCLATAAFEHRRQLAMLLAPVVPLDDAVLAALAADEDVVVRTAVARYLANSPTHPALQPLLTDEEQGVRMAAARALAASPDPAAVAPLQAHLAQGGLEEKLALLDAMLRRPHGADPALVASALADEAPLVREAALSVVAGSCRDEDTPALIHALTDDDPHVVVRAATALYLRSAGGAEAETEADTATDPEANTGTDTDTDTDTGTGTGTDTTTDTDTDTVTDTTTDTETEAAPPPRSTP